MTTKEVATLRRVEAGPRTVLIDYLQKLLDDAKTGELQGIAVVCEWKGNYSGQGLCLAGQNNYRTLGAVAVLQQELVRAINLSER